MSKWLNETILKGSHVTLLPLKYNHIDELLNAATIGDLNKLWYTNIPNQNNIKEYIETAINGYNRGHMLPFVVKYNSTNKIIGTTRFLNADHINKRIEIGSTWYAKKYHKTAVNTECKYLLLRHAFEKLNSIAVEFRTHYHNLPSRNAILKLGAKQDGILRNHRITNQGIIRDTVVFSILNSEWPTVKYSLNFRIKNK